MGGVVSFVLFLFIGQIKNYISYIKHRVNAHGIHSPFVFEFYNEVLHKSRSFKDDDIWALRKKLFANDRLIRIEDFGVGSRKNNSADRKISELAKVAGINRKYGKLLTKIVDFYKVENVIELGTSLGLGTSYLASSKSIKKIITIEGSEEVATVAKENFEYLQLKKIEQIVGVFDDNLEEASNRLEKIDLIYIDGNHQYDATKKYFDFFIDRAHDETFIIFDDIYWSEGMTKAWNEIIQSEKISVSIDLFRMGIVCKRKTQAKQHFVLKF